MGMFDSVFIEYELPEITLEDKPVSFFPGHEFQTKDMHCMMDSYLISNEGKLLYKEGNWFGKHDPSGSVYKDTEFHGILHFYTGIVLDNGNRYFIDYFAKFTDGIIVNVKHEIEGQNK
jgi:hypothetical protein